LYRTDTDQTVVEPTDYRVGKQSGISFKTVK